MKFFLIVLLTVNLWSFDEFINSMRKSGVKISFSTKKNSLKSIPRGMLGQEFIKAKQLDFNGMNLSDNLPTFLGEMRNLMVLNLEGVDISLRELKKIESLKINVLNLNNNPNLFSNGGKLIPIISKFGLTKLYLSNTDGRASDYLSIGTSLPELTVLDLSNNRIDSLENLYLANLSSLRILNLSNNSLSSFSTAHLPKRTLQKLDLSNTSFSNFNFTGDFPSLLSLDLQGNSSVKMDKKYKGAMVLSKATVTPSSLISKNSFSDSLSLELVSSTKLEDSNNKAIIIGDLMWQDEPYTKDEIEAYKDNRTYKKVSGKKDAINYCAQLDLLGYTDWRIPSLTEMQELNDNISKLKYVETDFSSSGYWTMDTDILRIPIIYNFCSYLPVSGASKDSTYFIRCVRRVVK